ncbi:aminotransferase class I/II-fold pyridoxal phosphate-dependent enzyme [Romboutsia sp.]|uniref:aminotransferase class I/II-fold pyridoxal phosphate-dependent enzyme n=1 Tax=Romboutsia sp. TaxID=1965302 RepID=UPI003F2CC175
MEFLDSLVANRFGGSSFFESNKRLYKFEKIKILTKEAMCKNPFLPLIDLGVGEPDKMANERISDVLYTEARDPSNRFYADNGILEFQDAASKYMDKIFNIKGLTSSNIMHGIGSKSILAMIPICFINPGDICLMPIPSYPTLGTYTKFLGGEVYSLPLSDKNCFFPDLTNIPNYILRKTKLLYINYPNNPTGQVANYEFYENIVRFAKENNILVVSDMAYAHLTYDDYKPLSIFSIDGSMDVCIEVHSLSKSFNMTGWRLGFVVGSENFIKLYSTIKSHTDSGQFRAIQKAGAFALDNSSLVDINIDRYSRRLDLLTHTLQEIGFKVTKPKGGFYLYAPIPKGVKNGIKFNSAEDASTFILSNLLVSTVPWDDCGSYLRFSVTYDADSVQDEILIMKELKNRFISLKFEF